MDETQIIVAARLAKEKIATDVVMLLSISLIATEIQSLEPLSFWVHMKLKIWFSFLALKEYDFLFILLVPPVNISPSQRRLLLLPHDILRKISFVPPPSRTHTHTRKWESCCLKYHNHIAQGEINCGFFWSPENFFLFLTKSLLLSSPSPSPSTNTDST